MWKRISEWLYRISTGWVALAAAVIFFVFTALVLPGQASQSDRGEASAGTPDLSLIYSSEQLYDWAEAYGEAGRREYVRVRFSFDVAWPLIYGAFLLTTISWLYARAFAADSWMRRLNVAPLLAMLFDFLENISTSLVMWRFPARTPVVDWLAPVFTLVKWALVGGSFVVLLVGVPGWIYCRVRKAGRSS